MNNQQRQAAINYVKNNFPEDEVGPDVEVDNARGFDEVPDGVWVHAWVKVPAEAIPGYAMTPPAPAAEVKVVGGGIWPFPRMDAARHPHLNTDNHE